MKLISRAPLIYFFATLFFLLILFLVRPIYLSTTVEQTDIVMSTPVLVKVSGVNAPRLASLAIAKMRQLEQAFSRFNPSSEVSLINRLAGKAPLEVSADTFTCVSLALIFNRLSGGAFDVTLGRSANLLLDYNQQKIFLNKAHAHLDLGGIGKGYAVESARRLLLKNGAKSGMIDMRSSIAVFGQRTWQVGVQHPRQKGVLLGTIILHDGDSLGTSGDYERGKHIINPATGRPAELCQAVTVIGKDAAETDALSTAIFVLGPMKGLALARSLAGIEVLIVDQNGKIYQSKGFNLIKP